MIWHLENGISHLSANLLDQDPFLFALKREIHRCKFYISKI